MQITAILSSPLFTWLSRRPGRNDKYHDFVSEKPIHPFSANRDHHHFKKTKNKVLPFVLSKFGHESTRWFMSYSKKMVSPSIEKKIVIFLADCKKKFIKTKESVSSMQNLAFISKEKGTEKLILLYFLLIT